VIIKGKGGGRKNNILRGSQFHLNGKKNCNTVIQEGVNTMMGVGSQEKYRKEQSSRKKKMG